MKASLCYHNSQGCFTPVWQGGGRHSSSKSRNSALDNPAWRTMLLTMCLGKSNRSWLGNGDAPWLGGMLQVYLRAERTNNYARFQVRELWRHSGLECDF